jgi:hypothetical protein
VVTSSVGSAPEQSKQVQRLLRRVLISAKLTKARPIAASVVAFPAIKARVPSELPSRRRYANLLAETSGLFAFAVAPRAEQAEQKRPNSGLLSVCCLSRQSANQRPQCPQCAPVPLKQTNTLEHRLVVEFDCHCSCGLCQGHSDSMFVQLLCVSRVFFASRDKSRRSCRWRNYRRVGRKGHII